MTDAAALCSETSSPTDSAPNHQNCETTRQSDSAASRDEQTQPQSTWFRKAEHDSRDCTSNDSEAEVKGPAGGGEGSANEPGGVAGRREEGVRKLEPGSYDTVVDTFGLCSHADPVGALKASLTPSPIYLSI